MEICHIDRHSAVTYVGLNQTRHLWDTLTRTPPLPCFLFLNYYPANRGQISPPSSVPYCCSSRKWSLSLGNRPSFPASAPRRCVCARSAASSKLPARCAACLVITQGRFRFANTIHSSHSGKRKRTRGHSSAEGGGHIKRRTTNINADDLNM